MTSGGELSYRYTLLQMKSCFNLLAKGEIYDYCKSRCNTRVCRRIQESVFGRVCLSFSPGYFVETRGCQTLK